MDQVDLHLVEILAERLDLCLASLPVDKAAFWLVSISQNYKRTNAKKYKMTDEDKFEGDIWRGWL